MTGRTRAGDNEKEGAMKPPRQLSRRDSLILQKSYLDFVASAYDKPPSDIVIPPKREIRRPIDGKPVRPTEHQEQCAVIGWWNHGHSFYKLPYFALFAIPNGGARDMITGARLKKEGVRRGVLDLCLAVPTKTYHGLYIEMKAGDNKPSAEQKGYIEYLNGCGYRAIVCWSGEEAIGEIKRYLGGELI
jgi:hypothetical protein